VTPVRAPALQDILEARTHIQGVAAPTPLVGFGAEESPRIFLKLENLQPIGSFKLRGAWNAMRLAGPQKLRLGVTTASAGNMAQGVAWSARRLGFPCEVVVPETAPAAKLGAIERLGGTIVKVPFEDWWQALREHRWPGMKGHFVHPVCDPAVIAGNGTIGLEILEDLPDVDAVLVPYGGGGLTTGIALAIRASKPSVKIFACEVETAAPLAAALRAGAPRVIEHRKSFVDGIGSKSVLEEMWPLVKDLVDGSIVVSLAEVEGAIRALVERNHLVAEGAGAVPVAAALSGRAGAGKLACVVSGGNLDPAKLCAILAG
jgi:threonine dehydratase